MILVRNLNLKPDYNEGDLIKAAASKAKIDSSRIQGLKTVKRSIDARKKDAVHYVVSAAFTAAGDENKIIKKAASSDVLVYTEKTYSIPTVSSPELRPVIVGFGPAGMFASLVLAEAGARPLIIERGDPVDLRREKVSVLQSGGKLDPESNVQFGEGGAGTFSDGKLSTGTHDSRIPFVLRTFHEYGAPESVTYDAKPHIGTDVLPVVVKNIRNHITELGGEILFNTRLDEICVDAGRISGIRVRHSGSLQEIPCEHLILAIGHSARDTFVSLLNSGVPMERKAFSMGARIEHRQEDINYAQYGEFCSMLPPADYFEKADFGEAGSAYTFCMCPGGEVFAAASEEGGVCTNGMSNSRRDGQNANAALLVTLHPEDFPGSGVLAGMEWQREIERKAFAFGGGNYMAPAQTVGDFLAGVPSIGPGAVSPSYRPGVVWGSLYEVLPEKICSVLRLAIPDMDRRLKGFASPDAVLTAPETRSSSPVRILRDAGCESPVKGLFPAGEGAGYAGGITSAAVDGIRCAEAVLSYYK